MTDPQTLGEGERGGALLSKISNEIVRAFKRYYGKGPSKAKSYMVDDLLFIVLRGGVTVAEETLLEANKEDVVRSFRQTFENEMESRLTQLIEGLTGRKVINYQSQILFDPDMSVEIFVFDSPATDEAIMATADAQAEEQDVGSASHEAIGEGEAGD